MDCSGKHPVLHITPDRDLSDVIVRGIREQYGTKGCSIRDIQILIQSRYAIKIADDLDFIRLIMASCKKLIKSGRLFKHGCKYRVSYNEFSCEQSADSATSVNDKGSEKPTLFICELCKENGEGGQTSSLLTSLTTGQCNQIAAASRSVSSSTKCHLCSSFSSCSTSSDRLPVDSSLCLDGLLNCESEEILKELPVTSDSAEVQGISLSNISSEVPSKPSCLSPHLKGPSQNGVSTDNAATNRQDLHLPQKHSTVLNLESQCATQNKIIPREADETVKNADDSMEEPARGRVRKTKNRRTQVKFLTDGLTQFYSSEGKRKRTSTTTDTKASPTPSKTKKRRLSSDSDNRRNNTAMENKSVKNGSVRGGRHVAVTNPQTCSLSIGKQRISRDTQGRYELVIGIKEDILFPHITEEDVKMFESARNLAVQRQTEKCVILYAASAFTEPVSDSESEEQTAIISPVEDRNVSSEPRPECNLPDADGVHLTEHGHDNQQLSFILDPDKRDYEGHETEQSEDVNNKDTCCCNHDETDSGPNVSEIVKNVDAKDINIMSDDDDSADMISGINDMDDDVSDIGEDVNMITDHGFSGSVISDASKGYYCQGDDDDTSGNTEGGRTSTNLKDNNCECESSSTSDDVKNDMASDANMGDCGSSSIAITTDDHSEGHNVSSGGIGDMTSGTFECIRCQSDGESNSDNFRVAEAMQVDTGNYNSSIDTVETSFCKGNDESIGEGGRENSVLCDSGRCNSKGAAGDLSRDINAQESSDLGGADEILDFGIMTVPFPNTSDESVDNQTTGNQTVAHSDFTEHGACKADPTNRESLLQSESVDVDSSGAAKEVCASLQDGVVELVQHIGEICCAGFALVDGNVVNSGLENLSGASIERCSFSETSPVSSGSILISAFNIKLLAGKEDRQELPPLDDLMKNKVFLDTNGHEDTVIPALNPDPTLNHEDTVIPALIPAPTLSHEDTVIPALTFSDQSLAPSSEMLLCSEAAGMNPDCVASATGDASPKSQVTTILSTMSSDNKLESVLMVEGALPSDSLENVATEIISEGVSLAAEADRSMLEEQPAETVEALPLKRTRKRKRIFCPDGCCQTETDSICAGGAVKKTDDVAGTCKMDSPKRESPRSSVQVQSTPTSGRPRGRPRKNKSSAVLESANVNESVSQTMSVSMVKDSPVTSESPNTPAGNTPAGNETTTSSLTEDSPGSSHETGSLTDGLLEHLNSLEEIVNPGGAVSSTKPHCLDEISALKYKTRDGSQVDMNIEACLHLPEPVNALNSFHPCASEMESSTNEEVGGMWNNMDVSSNTCSISTSDVSVIVSGGDIASTLTVSESDVVSALTVSDSDAASSLTVSVSDVLSVLKISEISMTVCDDDVVSTLTVPESDVVSAMTVSSSGVVNALTATESDVVLTVCNSDVVSALTVSKSDVVGAPTVAESCAMGALTVVGNSDIFSTPAVSGSDVIGAMTVSENDVFKAPTAPENDVNALTISRNDVSAFTVLENDVVSALALSNNDAAVSALTVSENDVVNALTDVLTQKTGNLETQVLEKTMNLCSSGHDNTDNMISTTPYNSTSISTHPHVPEIGKLPCNMLPDKFGEKLIDKNMFHSSETHVNIGLQMAQPSMTAGVAVPMEIFENFRQDGAVVINATQACITENNSHNCSITCGRHIEMPGRYTDSRLSLDHHQLMVNAPTEVQAVRSAGPSSDYQLAATNLLHDCYVPLNGLSSDCHIQVPVDFQVEPNSQIQLTVMQPDNHVHLLSHSDASMRLVNPSLVDCSVQLNNLPTEVCAVSENQYPFSRCNGNCNSQDGNFMRSCNAAPNHRSMDGVAINSAQTQRSTDGITLNNSSFCAAPNTSVPAVVNISNAVGNSFPDGSWSVQPSNLLCAYPVQVPTATVNNCGRVYPAEASVINFPSNVMYALPIQSLVTGMNVERPPDLAEPSGATVTCSKVDGVQNSNGGQSANHCHMHPQGMRSGAVLPQLLGCQPFIIICPGSVPISSILQPLSESLGQLLPHVCSLNDPRHISCNTSVLGNFISPVPQYSWGFPPQNISAPTSINVAQFPQTNFEQSSATELFTMQVPQQQVVEGDCSLQVNGAVNICNNGQGSSHPTGIASATRFVTTDNNLLMQQFATSPNLSLQLGISGSVDSNSVPSANFLFSPCK